MPEVTRDEIIGGRLVIPAPAEEAEAAQHGNLGFVLRAHVAPGYCAPLDLLTRFAEESDFATAACVLKDGVDPATGTRHLEELAFEILTDQNELDVTEKAFWMHRRGVRRTFALMLKGWQVCEWSPESRSWRPVEDSSIIDRCLAVPLPVAALLDPAAADAAVIEALFAKGNPVLQKMKTAAKAEGRAESILKVVAARGITVSEAQRQETLLCRDLERLDRWLSRAAVASSADEVFAET